MVQVVSPLSLTAEAGVFSWASLYGVCDEPSGNGTGLCPATSGFQCQYYSINAPYSFVHLSPKLYNYSKWQLSDISITIWCSVNGPYGKGTGKVHPRTDHKGPEGEFRYRSTLSLTSALDGGECSTPRPGRLTHGKGSRYQLSRRLRGPQGRYGRVRKISSYRVSIPGPSST